MFSLWIYDNEWVEKKGYPKIKKKYTHPKQKRERERRIEMNKEKNGASPSGEPCVGPPSPSPDCVPTPSLLKLNDSQEVTGWGRWRGGGGCCGGGGGGGGGCV